MKHTKYCHYFYLICTLSFSAFSNAQIQPKHAKLNFSQQALSTDANPANTALVLDAKHSSLMFKGMVNLSASLEYGDVDDLFNKYNELSQSFKPSDPEPGTPTNPIERPDPVDRPDLIDWDKVFEQYPDLESRVDVVKDRVISLAGLLALISTEGYAKTEVAIEAPFLVNSDYYGGTLLFGASYTGFQKLLV